MLLTVSAGASLASSSHCARAMLLKCCSQLLPGLGVEPSDDIWQVECFQDKRYFGNVLTVVPYKNNKRRDNMIPAFRGFQSTKVKKTWQNSSVHGREYRVDNNLCSSQLIKKQGVRQ